MKYTGLTGKRVLVTGASGGIGQEIAYLLGECDSSVGIHYKDGKSKAEQVAQGVVERGGKASLHYADLFETGDAIKLIKDFAECNGGIDILVNNAGGTIGAHPFMDLDEASWDQTFALNVKQPFFLMQQAFPYMIAQKWGKIVNISSISAKYGGGATSLHYGAAKAALDALTKGLSRNGAPYNILVNSVRAGFVNTSIHKRMGRTKADIEERVNLIPLKRGAEPREIAGMVLFLLSDTGDYITGEVFTVAGGD
jgi:3-oxoacyl-[acyl-carrier protein] reductase